LVSVVVFEQCVEAGDARSPELLVGVQQRTRPLDPRRVAADQTFSTVRCLGYEPRPFQHRHVLLHRSEGHVVVLRQLRHGVLTDQRATDDVAAGRIGEGPEDPVHLVVAEMLIYNHLVVR